MLLVANAPGSTDDIDIFWLEDEKTLEQALIPLREGVRAVAEANKIESDWFNYMTHLLLYDLVTIPKGKLWRRYGPLHIHIPPKEYILALKILAGRDKDINDSKLLLAQVNVKTRNQARVYLIGTFPLPHRLLQVMRSLIRLMHSLDSNNRYERQVICPPHLDPFKPWEEPINTSAQEKIPG